MIRCSFFICLLLLIVSCSPDGTPPSTVGYSGSLDAIRINGFPFVSMTDTSEEVDAFFTKNPGDTTSAAIAGAVQFNGFSLDLEDIPTEDTYYTLQLNYKDLNFDSAQAWSVAGGDGIPAFNFNFGGFPDYNGYFPSYPDTIFKSAGFTMNFSTANTFFADSVDIYGFTTDTVLIKRVSATAGDVVFSPSDLSIIDIGPGYFLIKPYAVTSQTFGGKTFGFIKENMIWHLCMVAD